MLARSAPPSLPLACSTWRGTISIEMDFVRLFRQPKGIGTWPTSDVQNLSRWGRQVSQQNLFRPFKLHLASTLGKASGLVFNRLVMSDHLRIHLLLRYRGLPATTMKSMPFEPLCRITFPGLRTREAGCRRPSRLKDGAAQTVLLSVGGPLINEANIGMP